MKPKSISAQADLLDMGFDMYDSCDSFESTKKINPKSMRAKGKITVMNGLKRELLTDLLGRLPEESEYIHLISNGRYDYYTFIPVVLSHVGVIDELWASTWTMNRDNCENMFELYDAGKIKDIHIITGIYFKRRESAVYASLVEGMVKRGQKYISCENHAKVILIRSGNKYYVIEGSANWTANPRIEQNIICQSEILYNFHKDWMNEYFD